MSRLRANLAINFASAVVPVLVMLVTVPLYIRYVGNDRYGVLLIAWTLLGYLGFLDFGMGRATTNALARLPEADHDARTRVIWSSLSFNAVLGALGWLLMWAGGTALFTRVIEPPPALVDEVVRAVPWLAPMLPIAMLTGVGTGVLEARERFGVLSVIQMTGVVAGQLLALGAAIAIGPSLLVILPIMLAVRAATGLAILAAAWRAERPGLIPRPDAEMLRSLGAFGSWVTVTNIVGPIMTTADQLVIGAVRGAAAVPHYAVPMNALGRAMIIPSVTVRTLFPAMSRADPEALAQTAARACNAIAVLMAPLAIGAWLVGDFALGVWLGAEFAAISAPVLKILALGFWINGLGYVAFSALQASGRARTVALTHLAELPLYAVLLWLGMHYGGIVGVAWAWTLRVLVDEIVLLWLLRLPARSLATAAVCAAVVGLSILSDWVLPPDPVLRILGAVVLGAVLAAATPAIWLPLVRTRGRSVQTEDDG